jgi:hypothetical protein
MNKKILSRTKKIVMKKSQNLLALFIAVFAFVCLSFSDVSAQNYLPKDEAITNLINENIALTESLPGLAHNSNLYAKTKEKIRVINRLGAEIKTGKTVAQAVELVLPNDDTSMQMFIRSFPGENGKSTRQWAIDEIMPLITE